MFVPIRSMQYLASQSTAMVPTDVHEKISDSYRLYLSLLLCEKPVITGTFGPEGFEVMRDLLVTVRGSREALAEKPLGLFTCCPLSPLKWSDVTSQNLLDCAELSIPVEIIPMRFVETAMAASKVIGSSPVLGPLATSSVSAS